MVVLPLEPVTSAVGIACSASHGTSSGAGNARRAASCGCRAPAPSDNVVVVGMHRHAARRARRRASAISAGFGFVGRQSPARSAAPDRSSHAGGMPRRMQVARGQLRLHGMQARPPGPLVDFGGGVELVERRGERQRRAARHGARTTIAPSRPAERARASRDRAPRHADSSAASGSSPRAFPAPRRCRRNTGCCRSAGAIRRREARAARSAAQSPASRSKTQRRARRAPRLPSPRTAASSERRLQRRRLDRAPPARGRVALGLELDDLLPRARQRIGEHQQQVAGLAHAQRGVDRLLFVGDDR